MRKIIEALKEELLPSYEDPQTRLRAGEYAQMLDDVLKKIQQINTEARLKAADRMQGKNHEQILDQSGARKPIQNPEQVRK